MLSFDDLCDLWPCHDILTLLFLHFLNCVFNNFFFSRVEMTERKSWLENQCLSLGGAMLISIEIVVDKLYDI